MSDINPGIFSGFSNAGFSFGGYPSGALPISSSSGNQANANAIATLAGAANQRTYLAGILIAASGVTTAVVVNCTIVGIAGGTATFPYAAIAGVLLQGPTFLFNITPPLISAAVAGAIVVTLPALGSGNTNAAVFAWGYQL